MKSHIQPALCFSLFLLLLSTGCTERSNPVIKPGSKNPDRGMLVLCGGDMFPDTLIGDLFQSARFGNTDYMVVLAMASPNADSSFSGVLDQVRRINNTPCYHLEFREEDLLNTPKLDSLKNARLIYFCDGDYSMVSGLLRDTPVHEAMIHAFESGSMIAATGEASSWMGKIVLTGEENFGEVTSDTFRKIWSGNAVYEEGLGLLDSVIVDHHFVTMSRYNRLFTALCDYEGMGGLGIDENTAIFLSGNSALVRGNSQALHAGPGTKCVARFQTMKMTNARFDLLVAGDRFEIR